MLIAVTGATGFVGGRLVERLVRDGHRVLAFGRRPPSGFRLAGLVEYRSWDVTRGPLIDAPPVDAVVHAAAAVSDWGPYSEMFAANVLGTRAVVSSFPKAGQFILISSASVYDTAGDIHRVREDMPLPDRYLIAYPQTKRLAEQEVLASDRPAVVLRPRAVYGPGDTTYLPRVLRGRRFGRLVAVGDGQNRISVTHVDNLVAAIAAVLERPEVRGVFNVADAVEPTLDELFRTILVALGLAPRVTYLPVGLAWPIATVLERAFRAANAKQPPALTRSLVSQLTHEYTLDISRAQELLGYCPIRNFREGFAEIGRQLSETAAVGTN